MAKTTKKKRPARRLKNVVVEEVSLVDSPAVPEAKFLIVKREETPEAEDVETESAEDVDLEKGRLLTAKQAARLEKIRDELSDILKTSRRVTKGEGPRYQEWLDNLSDADREHLLAPSAPSASSALQQAEQLIKTREQDQKATLDNQVMSKLDEALSQITKTSERTCELEAKFLEATGKVV